MFYVFLYFANQLFLNRTKWPTLEGKTYFFYFNIFICLSKIKDIIDSIAPTKIKDVLGRKIVDFYS